MSLSGRTFTINENPSITYALCRIAVNFTDGTSSYSCFECDTVAIYYHPALSGTAGPPIVVYENSEWQNASYRTITFTSEATEFVLGDDISNQAQFEAWLAENATEEGAEPEPVSNPVSVSKLLLGPKVMGGSSSSAAGAPGLAPAPAAGDHAKFLRGDGTWNNELPAVTSSDNGKALVVIEGNWGVGHSWRGIQDNLTSTSTTDSLSAAQGKALNDHLTLYDNSYGPVNGTNADWIYSKNLNDYKTSGIYPFATENTNAPATWFYLFVLAKRQDMVEQTAFAVNITWTREFRSGTWTAWKRLVTSDGDGATGTWGISITGNSDTASKLKNNSRGNVAYVTNDTHIMKLGYINGASYGHCTLLVTCSFWGNQHGSSDIIDAQFDTSNAGTLYFTISRFRLNGNNRTFYYKKDGTKLYLYAYVTGGNSYGQWNISVIQDTHNAFIPEFGYNQSNSSSLIEISNYMIAGHALRADYVNYCQMAYSSGSVAGNGTQATIAYPSGYTVANTMPIGCFLLTSGTRHDVTPVEVEYLDSSGIHVVNYGASSGQIAVALMKY